MNNLFDIHSYALRLAWGGTPVADVCREIGIAEATFYLWKQCTRSPDAE